MKPKIFNSLFRIFVLLILLASFVPDSITAKALGRAFATPPVDMFQLPWEQGLSWVAYGGFDNGTRRASTSPHNYKMGGAVDFAPHVNMTIGEDTSNFWVVAAAAGTVKTITSCYVIIDHGNGWLTEYWHLANIQVQLAQQVSRNQRLGVIADNKLYPVCTGNEHPGPHLHFVMRPVMKDTRFAGWTINYNIITNKTTFTKNGQTLGLLQPLLNIPSLQIVLREPIVWDTLYKGSIDAYRYEKWPLQLTGQTNFTLTATPGATGVIPLIVLLNSSGIEIARGNGTLTSTQPAGNYFVQIQPVAGSGFYNLIAHREGTSGTTITPTVTSGATASSGTPTSTPTSTPIVTSTSFVPTITALPSNTPTSTNTSLAPTSTTISTNTVVPTITFTPPSVTAVATNTPISTDTPVSSPTPTTTTVAVITSTPVPTNTLASGTLPSSQTPVVPNTPTFTPPPMTPTISPTTCNQAELTGYVNIPPGTLMSPGTTFTQSWGLRNIGWCTWTTDYHLVFYSGDQMGAPLSVNIATYDIAPGQVIIVSVPFTAPVINGHFTSLWKLSDASGIQFGVGASANDPLILDINVSNPNTTPSSPTPTITSIPSSTPVSAITPTATIVDGPYVLTSANPLNLVVGNTGLITVSLNNIPVEGYTSAEFTCTYNQNLISVSNMNIAGLFGADPVSGTLGPQNGSFILGVAGSNGNKAMGSGTAFTFNVQGLQVGQTIVECTARVSKGLGVLENILSIPTNVSVVGFVTPSAVPTTVPTSATLTGQVLASKLVTITLYNSDSTVAASTTANPDGTFSLTAPGGAYTVVATVPGFLSAQGSVTLINGSTNSKPVISLIAGDIDGNSIINQIDALTIGMNYNNMSPAAADLNNDGFINVLDLGILAQNYGASGALAW